MQRVQDIDFRRSQDLFIHGMIGDSNGGTCVSMPVVYTAVARRLGYPVKRVLAKAHVFCRWDAPKDRFNIEATNQGMNCFDDEYYKTWPEKVSDAEVRANRYLLSLSPAEELASFMASRGHCLLDNGRVKDACEAYMVASRLAPRDPAYLAWARQTQDRCAGGQMAVAEEVVARQRAEMRARSRRPSDSGDRLAGVSWLDAFNTASMQRSAGPAAGVPPSSSQAPPGVGLPQPYRPPVPGQPPRP